jgi:AraC-like DNA-binding protein
VLASVLQGNLVFGVRYGISPEQLCKLAKVPLDELSEPQRYVPLEWSINIWRVLVAQLPSVNVGIEMGLFWSIDRIGFAGEMMRHSSTLLEVLDKVARFSQLIDTSYSATPIQLEVGEQRVTLVLPEERGAEIPERTEALAFCLVAQLRMLSGMPVRPIEARFSYSRSEPLLARYRAFFECPVTLGSTSTALVFERATLEQPVQGGNPDASAFFEAYLQRVLARNLAPDFVLEVRRAIASQLEQGEASQPSVARALGMSLRSLQRKLDDSGVNYRELVDAQRRTVALRLLANPTTTINEVAYAAGYRDSGSFVRAFRRWTGRSPSEYRKSNG